MDSAKHNIKKIVASYVKEFAEEFELFKVQMEGVRRDLANDFAEVSKGSGSRALYEMPENLQAMLVHNLTADQMTWLKRGGVNGHEGGRWFVKTFPVFAIPNKI